MSTLPLTGIAIAIVLAAALKSVTGFGASLILMPIFTVYFDIKVAALLLALIDLISNSILFFRDGRHASFSSLKEVAVGLIGGTLLGVILLSILQVSFLKALLGVLILAYIILNQFNPTIGIKTEWARKVLGYLFGFIGGVFGGMFNANGPAIFMYVKSVFPNKEVVRANIIFLFFIDSIWRTGLLTITGQYTFDILLTFTLVALPALLFGLYIGTLIDKRVHAKHYTNISKLVLAVSGIRLLLH